MMDKQESQKKIIKLLQDNPIIQIACRKTGISRSTFYRWRHGDTKFKKSCHRALNIGIDIINDAVESVLIRKTQEGEMKAVIYWLNNNHKKYRSTFQGYNERHRMLIQELEEEKEKQKRQTEEERGALVEALNILKKLPKCDDPNITEGEYDSLISA